MITRESHLASSCETNQCEHDALFVLPVCRFQGDYVTSSHEAEMFELRRKILFRDRKWREEEEEEEEVFSFFIFLHF